MGSICNAACRDSARPHPGKACGSGVWNLLSLLAEARHLPRWEDAESLAGVLVKTVRCSLGLRGSIFSSAFPHPKDVPVELDTSCVLKEPFTL